MGVLTERAARRVRIPEELGIVGALVGLVGFAVLCCIALCSMT